MKICEICGKEFRFPLRSRKCPECLKIKACQRCGNKFKSKSRFFITSYCPECSKIIASPASCNGCAYLETRQDLVFTDSFLAYNETRTANKCLKLNIAITQSIYECPHRKTIQQVMDETSTKDQNNQPAPDSYQTP